MKDYNKNKESSFLKYWDINKLYGWEMLQKLRVNKFEWIKDTSKFNEDFTTIIMRKVIKVVVSKLMVNFLKNYMNFVTTYYFYQKG